MATPSFPDLTNVNSELAASLNQGHTAIHMFSLMGFTNGKLYANPTGGTATTEFLIPEQAETSDPSSVVDVSKNLTSMGVPTDLPIYLQMKFNEFDDFITVGEVIQVMKIHQNRIDGLIAVLNSFAPGMGNDKVLNYLTSLQGVHDAVNADLAGLGL